MGFGSRADTSKKQWQAQETRKQEILDFFFLVGHWQLAMRAIFFSYVAFSSYSLLVSGGLWPTTGGICSLMPASSSMSQNNSSDEKHLINLYDGYGRACEKNHVIVQCLASAVRISLQFIHCLVQKTAKISA